MRGQHRRQVKARMDAAWQIQIPAQIQSQSHSCHPPDASDHIGQLLPIIHPYWPVYMRVDSEVHDIMLPRIDSFVCWPMYSSYIRHEACVTCHELL